VQVWHELRDLGCEGRECVEGGVRWELFSLAESDFQHKF